MINLQEEVGGGSSGGQPINSVLGIHSADEFNPSAKIENQGTWLQTGVMDTDIAAYPDAVVLKAAIVEPPIGHLPSTNMEDSCTDGTHWYYMRSTTAATTIYKVDAAFAVVATWTVNSFKANTILWDGTHIVIYERYYSTRYGKLNRDTGSIVAWVASSTPFHPNAMTYDGTNYIMTGQTGSSSNMNPGMHVVTPAGATVKIDVQVNGAPVKTGFVDYDLDTNRVYFLVNGQLGAMIVSGTFTANYETIVDIRTESMMVSGLITTNTVHSVYQGNIYHQKANNTGLYILQPAVGLPTRTETPITRLLNYIRIK